VLLAVITSGRVTFLREHEYQKETNLGLSIWSLLYTEFKTL